LATSTLFRAGNRIRLTVAFADTDNFDTPIIDPAPEIRLLRNTSYSTYLELPIAQKPSEASLGILCVSSSPGGKLRRNGDDRKR